MSTRLPVGELCAAWMLALAACLLTGCNLPQHGSATAFWRKVPLDASTGFYEVAKLSYRLDAGAMQQPLDVTRVEGQRVVFEQVASSPVPEQSIGTLSIEYPHPSGLQGIAQVRFTIESNSSNKKPASQALNIWPLKRQVDRNTPTGLATHQPEIHEVWSLDIPRAESDLYFKLLASQNFYSTDRPTAVAQLRVSINGNEVRKTWDEIAEFNALAQRIRREGQLVSYARPGVLAGRRHSQIASTQVYADLLARSGAPPPAGAQTLPGLRITSAFAMSPVMPAPGAGPPQPQQYAPLPPPAPGGVAQVPWQPR